MTIWVDAHFSPAITTCMWQTFAVSATAVRDLRLRDATNREIFLAVKQQGAVVMTKDRDFLQLLDELGPPPKVFGSLVVTPQTHVYKKFSHIPY